VSMPIDPQIITAAETVWATFLALQAAGFTEAQALSLVSDMLRAAGGSR
jgi:hypothetical protein